MDIAGQTIVIVGGTSGIGLATARAAVALGARVRVIGRDPDKLARALAELADRASGLTIDAGDAEAVRSALADLVTVDHLVLSASGAHGAGPVAELDEADLRRGFDAKFWVYWHAIRAALPQMRRDGSITMVTAASARVANPGTSGLAAINGALGAMVLPLARELAPLRVNAVSPGVIDTGWWDKRAPDTKETFFASVAARTPAGRVGRVEEVANAILFLTSATYTTGAIVDVDGGMRTAVP